ncbi:hypothetical protein SASPL_125790 [Salvia splendens]|uniref:IBH1-like N-terminal domain-containing protein n=1 Tax=Salvia splendens TaxID=180675 RepID=A0A8X8XJ73_SALSN|nr:hypothetical protein SASPL_125790 [Salvia splendens]
MQKSLSSSLMVKQEFFTKWKKGLKIYSAFNKEMTIMERKRAIKLSADVAIAATRSSTTQWSRAVVADVSSFAAGAARIAAEEILGRKLSTERRTALSSKKIMRRRRRKAAARGAVSSSAAAVAKKVAWNRRRVLKRLIPGWKKLDEISLIKETLDYIASLQVQVDVFDDASVLSVAVTTNEFMKHADDEIEDMFFSLSSAKTEPLAFWLFNSHDLKTVKEENKIMAMDLSSIVDPDSRAYFQAERRRILQKRAQQQEQPNDYATRTYPPYFDNIGGSGSGLPDY